MKKRLAEHTKRVEAAQERRRQVLGLVRGSKLRVALLEAELVDAEQVGLGLEALLSKLGLTAAAFAMMEVVNGNLVYRDPKMAMDVAKLGIEVHRAMAMDEAPDRANLTPDEREKRRAEHVAAIRSLTKRLEERAKEAADDLTVAEVDAVPSPPAAPTLGIVTATNPPVHAQEA